MFLCIFLSKSSLEKQNFFSTEAKINDYHHPPPRFTKSKLGPLSHKKAFSIFFCETARCKSNSNKTKYYLISIKSLYTQFLRTVSKRKIPLKGKRPIFDSNTTSQHPFKTKTPTPKQKQASNTVDQTFPRRSKLACVLATRKTTNEQRGISAPASIARKRHFDVSGACARRPSRPGAAVSRATPARKQVIPVR